MINHRHEKLHLSQDTCVDGYKLPQHQINNIRFLYKQYKKKNQGVIINDPGGYGKTLPVVLFLNTIKAHIQKPILIVCDDSAAVKWKQYLFEKTDFLNIGGANVKITFGTTINLATYKRQEWSVMVIDADTVNWSSITNSKDRATFHVDYKIWIISEDLKNDLNTLSSIYNWIYQNKKFNLNDFKPKTRTVVDKFAAATRLDYFLHDSLIRGSNFTPKEIAKIISLEISPKISTDKNKDSTGTKIKSSKRKLNDNPQTDVYGCSPNKNIKDVKYNTNDIQNKEIVHLRENSKFIESPVYNEYSKTAAKPVSNEITGIKRDNADTSLNTGGVKIPAKTDDKATFVFCQASDIANEICNNSNESIKLSGDNEIVDNVSEKSDPNELVFGDSDKQCLRIDKVVNERVGLNDIEPNVSEISVKEMSNGKKIVDVVTEEKAPTQQAQKVDTDLKGIEADLDTKMRELEEKILKKFKGSVFDSIF